MKGFIKKKTIADHIYRDKIVFGSFAWFCYENIKLEELVNKIEGPIDGKECLEWNLSPKQWRREIKLALLAKIELLKEYAGVLKKYDNLSS